MNSLSTIKSNEKHEVVHNHHKSIAQIITDDIIINDSSMPCRSFHCVSGINISSGIMQIDPELVDSASIADIVHSIESNNLSKYLSSMDNFTAKFMSKSLQYVRAFRFEPHYNCMGPSPAEDSYIDYGEHMRSRYVHEFVEGPSDYNADEQILSYDILSETTDDINKLYGRLQYMCDYFKYYVLESQFECLPHITKYQEKSSLLLKTIEKEKKSKQHISIEFPLEVVCLPVQKDRDEYKNLITSIKNECLDLMRTRGTSTHVKNIKLLKVRYLDNSTRDALIKSLMEYYLLIIDKFESMADLNFKYRDEHLAEKVILPVPREVAEVVHEEIETGITTSNYNDVKTKHFFCDLNRCLCLSSFGGSYDPKTDHNMGIFTLGLIRKYVMESVVSRMKRHILSLNM
ncbi:hypothetical protein [Candidatus Ichthyocystis sparus]|uniref:hypothetical protein n=1 Tax=Candidatus Ichthyocystis sparus TaxID=1561004 RepID=UPI000B87C0D7|nr:hypothetical protein [Candidatus Ichthyocystis sparus]